MRDIFQKYKDCCSCNLYKSRTNLVFGSGNPESDTMFIGEAPGEEEDESGMPFVGRAGGVLDDLLDSIGISRDDVYIVNVIKCRPLNNANPTNEQIDACRPILKEQIKRVKPKIIVLLGRVSLNSFLPDKKIGTVHGKVKKMGSVLLFASYHPAAALYKHETKDVIFADFKRLKYVIDNVESL